MTPAHAQVVSVELRRLALDLRTPLRSAHGTETIRDLVLVRVELADGTSGWGECSALARPTYTAEYTAGAWRMLIDELVPDLLAGGASTVIGHPMAGAALEGALLDARLRQRGARLVEHLGRRHGPPQDRVRTTAVVGRGDSVDATVAAVQGHVDAGVAMVKLKVTPRPQDLDTVAAVRATWPELAVAADGNASLDARSLSILDGCDLAYIEQPHAADDLLGSAASAKRLGTPVALDESITSLASLEVAVALGAGSVINVKPARLGGVEASAELARAAAEAGCGVFVGGMLESGIGRAAALAVAALPACTLPTDLGPSERVLVDDVCEPIIIDGDGAVVLPMGAGIGVSPRSDRLDACTTDVVVCTR